MVDPKVVSKVKLNDGHEVPIIGIGTWQSPPDGSVYRALRAALDNGYRHIDGAYAYQNEDEVGKAINDAIKEGVVKREELFVVTKVWLKFFTKERAQQCVKTSLSKLGLSYLDLVLIHWPFSFSQVDDGEIVSFNPDGTAALSDVDFTEAWKGLEDLVGQGVIRSIGISNFSYKQTERLLSVAKIKPVINQVECHPYLPQTKLLEWSKQRGIVLTAYSPLGNPGSTFAGNQAGLIKDPVVVKIAEKYGKTPAQVLIRFQIDRGIIVIPKSVKPERIIENIKVFDFKLTPDDIKALEGLDKNERFHFPGYIERGIVNHPNYPWKTPDDF